MKYYCVIYSYTTKLNRKVFQVKEGSARRKATSAWEAANIRIKEQVTAANSADPYEILNVEDVSDICETGEKHESLSKLRQLEQTILHPKMKRMGMWVPSDNTASEWFFDPAQESVDNVVNVGRQIINEVRHGVMALEDFPAFPYQQTIVDWATDKFNSGVCDVLINAIMRAGKCFITYEIARAIAAKKMLVVTAKVGVNDSWSSLLPNGEENHVNYADWEYHNYKKIKHIKSTKNTDVVFVSLQFINKHFDNPNPLLQDIFATSWDLVAFDEQHYATETDNTQRLWDTLKFKHKVELSGTPYKTVLSGRYEAENIYNFDYVDEQRLRREALQTLDTVLARAFKYRADINYAMVNVPDKIKAMIGEDGFTFPKLLATEKGAFKNVIAVNEFLTFAVQTYKKPPARFQPIADMLSRHALWVLPNDVSAINALEKMLKKHPFFGKRRIINASGKGVKDIQMVKDLIQRDNIEGGVGTITLTCGRFLEGTSIPEWWSVHQMNNDKSAADYFQGSFRCKTPNSKDEKASVVVFDYAPDRFVSVVYQHCEQVANKGNVNQVIAQWLDVSEVYDYDGNQWTTINGEEISRRFLSDINNYMDRVGQAVDPSGISANIIQLLQDKKKDSNQVTAVSRLNLNEVFAGSNKKRIVSSGIPVSGWPKQRDPAEEAEQRVRYALKQIFKLIDVAWADDIQFSNLNDIVNCTDSILVDDITGLTPSEWGQILPAVNQLVINRAIGQYNDFQ